MAVAQDGAIADLQARRSSRHPVPL
jgi:hypothetical protein